MRVKLRVAFAPLIVFAADPCGRTVSILEKRFAICLMEIRHLDPTFDADCIGE